MIRQSNELLARDFDVSIVYLDGDEEVAFSFVAPKVNLVYLKRRKGFDWRLILRLAQFFRQNRIDIVHSHNWTTFIDTVLAARLARVPVVIHGEHGRDSAEYKCDWKRLWLRKYLASQCDHLTTVSSDIAQILKDIWKVPSWKVSWIPNGVRLDMFKPAENRHQLKRILGINEDSIIVGTVVGNIRAVKDLPTLLKAFKLVYDKVPGVRLFIVR